MSRPLLSFYDHHRQDYHEGSWHPRHRGVVGEFMLGEYFVKEPGGVGPGGEFQICLYDFYRDWNSYEGNPNRKPLALELNIFTGENGGLGAFRRADRMGLTDALNKDTVYTRDDLSRLLIELGFKDRSHIKLNQEEPLGSL